MFTEGCDFLPVDMMAEHTADPREVTLFYLTRNNEYDLANGEPRELFGDHRSESANADNTDSRRLETLLAIITKGPNISIVALVFVC